MLQNHRSSFEDFVGETVTIFTTSGGASGSGFTGVILTVDDVFIRLVTRIGPPPECTLVNTCRRNFRWSRNDCLGNGFAGNELARSLGSIVDIPIDKIAAFIHNIV